MSSRKILIAAIVVLLIIVCVGLYFLFFGANSSTVTPPGQTNQTGSLPATGDQSNPSTGASTSTALEKSFGVISDQPTLDYFVDGANTVTAIEPDGEVVQVANGQMSTISSTTLQNILGASFSYNGAKILVSLGDSSNPQTSVFDVASKMWTALPAGLQSPAWSPSDYRIAYTNASAQGTETLATIDASKAKPTPVALTTLYSQDLAVVWPSKNQIVLYTKPSAYVAGSAWVYDLQKTTLASVAAEIPGLATLWSGNGFVGSAPMALQFSSGADGLGGLLSLTDFSGNILQRLKLVTLPSKCLFASASSSVMTPSSTTATTTSTPYLFCGVPRDQNTFSVSHLPDDYDQMALFTSDDIYRVNLQSGAIDAVFNDTTQNLDVSDVKLFNGTLFFINRYDQKLYGIGLITM